MSATPISVEPPVAVRVRQLATDDTGCGARRRRVVMDALHECPLCKSPRLITAAIKGTVFVACRDCLALVEVNESTRFIVLVPPITTSPKD